MTFDATTLDVPLVQARILVAEAWEAAWYRRPPVLMSQWAEDHRKLPEQGAAEPGDWRNSRTPFLVEIMDCLSVQHPAERVVFMKSIQVGGTEVLINALGYFMCEEPGPIMVLVPGVDMAMRHSKQRIAPSIAASEEWSRAVRPARSRDSGNTTLVKEFDGGFLVIATANSPTALRSMPVRYLLADEIDKYARDLDGEGNALVLAEGRTNTFQGRRKIFLVSSPTIAGQSLIAAEYAASDRREYSVPCPHCNGLQALVIEQLLDDARYLCVHCGHRFEEKQKPAMMSMDSGARWIPQAPGVPVPGFHINALYAPYGLGDSWERIVTKREDARKAPDKQVTFTNMVLGLPFESERSRTDARVLESRAELGWRRGTVPRGGLIVSTGVDCQHDRFAVETWAWGRGERGWLVDYEEIPGDPSRQEGYAELDLYLQRIFPKGRGVQLVARAVSIDGGNWTEEVAKFVRARQRRLVKVGAGYQEQHILLVRGRTTRSERVVYRPKRAEVNQRGQTLARSVGVWGVGTDVAKNVLFTRIAADAHAEHADDRMMRWPGGRVERIGTEDRIVGALPYSFFEGLTAEYLDLRTNRWVHDRSIRNEPIDGMVYAYHAALSPMVRIDLLREHEWAALEASLEPVVQDLFDGTDSRETDEVVEPAPLPVAAPAATPKTAPVRPADSRGTARRSSGIEMREGWGL